MLTLSWQDKAGKEKPEEALGVRPQGLFPKTHAGPYKMTTDIPQNPGRHLDLPLLRQIKGISLEQIAQTSKISIRYLKAIEQGQFEKLPGGIFNTSYIRQYARAIECEEAELLAYYNSRSSHVA